MAKKIIDLSALLDLEKAGKYQEALTQIRALSKEARDVNLNIRLLEQRLGVRKKNARCKRSTIPQHTSGQEQQNSIARAKWSAIITMWKRKDYLAEQLAAINAQSIPPEEIIIILNESNLRESMIREIGGPDIKIIRSDINSLYSRWAISYIAKGDYISVFDDDVVPGKKWIANAIRACARYNAVVGPAGRVYNESGLHGYYKMVTPGGNSQNSIDCSETDVYCDWICNSYLFKREWVGHILSSLRHNESFKTFDDIQLATSLYLSGGIQCVTPMQPKSDPDLHGSLQHDYGNDSHAIWKNNSSKHFAERKEYITSLIRGGYTPVQQRDNLYRFHLIVPFGERNTLERCLLSIKGQDYTNFTCTLIDDCCDNGDALEILKRTSFDSLTVRYIKTSEKCYPLRAREIATDMLDANPADVIIHVDGDDWLPYPDVLSRLNTIYRKGGTLASYGNAISVRDKNIKTTSQIERDSYGNPRTVHRLRNFEEYTPYMMSKRWNVAQKNKSAEWFPMRKVGEDEILNDWINAPWCGMHLRTFQFAKWLELNRSTFTDDQGNYLRIATDAAIFIPILNSCKHDTIAFVDELSYIYQDANNTIHAKKEVTEVERAKSLNSIASAKKHPNLHQTAEYLVSLTHKYKAPLGTVVALDNFDKPFEHSKIKSQGFQNRAQPKGRRNAIATIVTPNFLADGMICLLSYARNLRGGCEIYIYVSTENEFEISYCLDIFKDSGVNPIFPSTLKHTKNKSLALKAKYELHSDEYRWSMKAVILIELIMLGNDSSLFLDPDTYTVSDITDVQQKLNNNPITVFPHFRDPDNDYLRSVLYKDGFFNGGMLGATRSGISHLERLYDRCLKELSKDPARNRWDDQKYFDIFTLEVDGLSVNLDRGIDYNPWNYEPVEGLVAPSQRSILLGSGYFVRHWHVATMLIKNSIELKQAKYSVFRPIISIYLLSLAYMTVILLAKSKNKSPSCSQDRLGLGERLRNITGKLSEISPVIPVGDIEELLQSIASPNSFVLDKFLEKLESFVIKSICFDNFSLFADVLLRLFPSNQGSSKLAAKLRSYDLRYRVENSYAPSESGLENGCHEYRISCSGQLMKNRLDTLKSCGITY